LLEQWSKFKLKLLSLLVINHQRDRHADSSGLRNFTMYRLQLLRGETWLILDEQDDEVFRGALPACEGWLDHSENQVAPRETFSEFRLRDWIQHCITGTTATDDIPAETPVTTPRDAGHLP